MLTVKVKLADDKRHAHVVLEHVRAVLGGDGSRCVVWLSGADGGYLELECTADEFMQRAAEVQRTHNQLEHARQVRMRWFVPVRSAVCE